LVLFVKVHKAAYLFSLPPEAALFPLPPEAALFPLPPEAALFPLPPEGGITDSVFWCFRSARAWSGLPQRPALFPALPPPGARPAGPALLPWPRCPPAQVPAPQAQRLPCSRLSCLPRYTRRRPRGRYAAFRRLLEGFSPILICIANRMRATAAPATLSQPHRYSGSGLSSATLSHL
jgi:hypothetical protein